ncbi:TIGR03619 family F420-dependent LLM class oxidoreductase [Nocardia sp. NPDC052566]|uniref:TIGR03619 family F420-dependent LLM class oxidoreductase n=1 Tax=Nocardia sp. NPDC052566 TaxID=3364330 RepID=UPI0037C8DAF0
MKIGFALPQFGGQAHEGAQVARFAREIEAAGADSLWVGDRMFAAVDPTVGYGGGPTIPPEFNAILDPFALLALAAGVTERVRLGTNVLVVPWYPPALLARSLTTIDVISAGRLTPGFGIGWSPEEYQAANVPFTARGARLDETLDALEHIWTTDPAEYRGARVSVPRHRSELKPVRRPHPPIHLAGFTPESLARIGRRAQGWLPVLMVPGPAEQADYLVQQSEIIARHAEIAGRDPHEIATVVRVNPAANTTAQQIADAVHRLVDATSFDDIFVDLTYPANTVDGALDVAADLLKLLR